MPDKYKKSFKRIIDENDLTGKHQEIADILNTPDNLGFTASTVRTWYADEEKVYSRPIHPAFFELFEIKVNKYAKDRRKED